MFIPVNVGTVVRRRPLFTGFPTPYCRVTSHPLASRVSVNASLIFHTPLPPPFSQHGRLVLSLEYGYPSRHLILWLASNRHVSRRQAALQRALTLVGKPPRHRYVDITVALLEVELHKKSAWAMLSS